MTKPKYDRRAILCGKILEMLKTTDKLSNIFPSALILSNMVNNKELVKWIQLEMNGYFNTNPALTQEVVVPEYRIVPGQYHDVLGRPLIITDPKMRFVNEYRLRHSALELEKLAESKDFISIHDADFIDIIKRNLKVDVFSFRFSPTAILGVLNAIRTDFINRMLNIAPQFGDDVQSNNERESNMIYKTIHNLHPSVQKVAGRLFSDRHYRQAILDTYILLVNKVKEKSGQRDLDGVHLMQKVFSPKNPVIKVSDDPDEQQGFMWLFSGAVMAIRNPKAHRLIEQKDPHRALEWLSFASVLMRILDDAKVDKQAIHKT
jgi:uncharacterized protein (TIGR02391 family)